MTWKTIRLELAATREFPAGSASRAFLLRLPVRDDGTIDEEEVAHCPTRATVRRYWGSEPDSSGRIVPVPGGWECRCDERGADGRAFRLPSPVLKLGQQVEMIGPDGCRLPFRVASMGR